MNLHSLKALTIVFESVLKEQLLAKVLELGASGYTLTETSGAGPRDMRNAFGTGNLKLEIICESAVAEAIMTYVSHHYFRHYAVIAWVADVEVVRGAYYVKKS